MKTKEKRNQKQTKTKKENKNAWNIQLKSIEKVMKWLQKVMKNNEIDENPTKSSEI